MQRTSPRSTTTPRVRAPRISSSSTPTPRWGPGWWRDETLADDLDRHHAEWLAIGRPTLGDYRVGFVPIEEGRPPPPTALDRPSFRELLWLKEP
jgi:hypothetical protein